VRSPADPAATPPASPQVIWVDSAEDFEPVGSSGLEQWGVISSNSSLDGIAAFDENGLTSITNDPFLLVRFLAEPIGAAALPGVVADASTDAGPAVTAGIITSASGFIPAENGLQGTGTLWPDPLGGASRSTEDLADDLEANGEAVTGYFVAFNLNTAVLLTAEGSETSEQMVDLLAAESNNFAARAAVPATSGIASIRFGDLTTYFTPQPTPVLILARASFTSVQASTTGIPVSGSGFAPGETVTVGLGTGQSGGEVEGVAFVADADGNASGTVVLQAGLEPGTFYTLALVGSSSGQVASNPFTITAGAAAVAVPVPGEATFTG
jgi:hypothetical protein